MTNTQFLERLRNIDKLDSQDPAVITKKVLYSGILQEERQKWQKKIDEIWQNPNLKRILNINKADLESAIKDGSMEDIVKHIRNDQLLVESIIKVSNSPIYPKFNPINDILRAVITIGIDEMEFILRAKGLARILKETKTDTFLMVRTIFSSIFSSKFAGYIYDNVVDTKSLKKQGSNPFLGKDVGIYSLLHNNGELILIYQSRKELNKLENEKKMEFGEYYRNKKLKELESERDEELSNIKDSIHGKILNYIKRDLGDEKFEALDNKKKKALFVKYLIQNKSIIARSVEIAKQRVNRTYTEKEYEIDKKNDKQVLFDFFESFIPHLLYDKQGEYGEYEIFGISHEVYGLLIALEFGLTTEIQIVMGLHHILFEERGRYRLEEYGALYKITALYLSYLYKNSKSEKIGASKIFFIIFICYLSNITYNMAKNVLELLYSPDFDWIGLSVIAGGRIKKEILNTVLDQISDKLVQTEVFEEFSSDAIKADFYRYIQKFRKNFKGLFPEDFYKSLKENIQLIKGDSEPIFQKEVLKNFLTIVFAIFHETG